MAHRPLDEHDRVLNLESQLNKFRNSNITQRNNGTQGSGQAFGLGSKTSSLSNMNGPWAITPANHNVGSFNTTTNAFTNNVADGSGYYHINLLSTSVIVIGTPSPLTVTYIDGPKSNGQIVLMRATQGGTFTLKKAGATDTTQGNLKLDTDIVVDDHHIIILQFFNDIGTGGGKYIVLSGVGGSGGSNLWSNITIDVSKDMAGKGLTDLTLIDLVDATPAHSDPGAVSSYIFDTNYNVINSSSTNNNRGHTFSLNGTSYFEIIHNFSSLPFTDYLFTTVPFNMNNNTIYNINTLSFNSSTVISPFITSSGDDKVINASIHGFDILELSNSFNGITGVPDNGILEIFGTSHGVHSGVLWVPAFKVFNTSATVVNGNYVGGIYMDALDSTLTQRTFGAIFTIADSVSGSLAGRLSLQTIVPSGTSLQEYMSISNAGIGVNVDIVPSGFASIQAGNVSFPFKNVYSAGLKYESNSILLAATDMTYNAVSSANHKFVINSTTLFGIETDNTFGDIGYVDFYQGHRYTSATSGTGSALPATPYGYLIILVNGVRFKMPYYNV